MRLKLSALWKLARPFTCLPPAIGILSGVLTALGSEARRSGRSIEQVLTWADLQAPHGLTSAIVLGTLAAIALNIYSNVLNQLCDLEIDRQAKPERPLVLGTISKGGARSFALAALIASLVWAMGIRPHFDARPEFLYCCLFAALATTAYSLPPLRLKKHGLAANLSIALARGLALKVAGWTIVLPAMRPFDAEPWFLGAIFGCYTLGAVTSKDFADAPYDAACGVRSLPVSWGFEKAAWFTLLCMSLPWLAFPVLTALGVLHLSIIAATVLGFSLGLYGAWTGYKLVKDPHAFGKEQNHPAWKHMYLLMMAAQIGTAIVYML